MKKILLFALLISKAALANLHLAPPDFDYQQSRAIFVDFKTAHYAITYDTRARAVTVKSEIRFTATKAGRPIFDLIPNPSNLTLNGRSISQSLISLPNDSKVRLLSTTVEPGDHVLTMEHQLSTNVSWYDNNNVRSAFWIRDLRERLFWEQYVPSNLEFDQYAMTMDVSFKGKSRFNQEIMANGVVTKTATNTWRIEFPAWYTTSAAYFHTFPTGAFTVRRFDVPSIDGRKIPFTIYALGSSTAKKFSDEAIRVFKELEGDYGAWPHPFFIAYGSGSGGMEHAGATMTSFGALDHEMLHCYFAKGVIPANGNTGWIDEGIARWRDRGYPRLPTTGGVANLANRSVYARNTDNRAYSVGSDLWGHVDHLMANSGGLKPFLRAYFEAHKYTVMTTEHFKNNLELFSGMDLTVLFQDQVMRDPAKGLRSQKAERGDEHNHPALTEQQLRDLL
jgi:hypothetical protein